MTSQSELIPTMPGDILRYERERQGLSIERAAELSKIKPSVLLAIESGDTHSIPSVYLRGYIRNYAHYLGLDPGRLEQHMAHVKSSDPEVRSVFELRPKPAGTERWLKATSYLAASALIATLAWQFTHEAVRFSQGDAGMSRGTAPGPDTVPDSESGEESSPPSAKRHLNASIASIEMLKQGSPSPVVEDTRTPWNTLDDVSGPTSSSLLPDPQHGLRVTTSADTWVEILDADGAQLEMDLIRADESRLYDGKQPFRVLIGRASAVNLQLDGEAVDLAPYTRGNVARMTLGSEQVAAAEPQTEEINR
jgi:cytoskeleton protein RodZ